MGVDRFDGIEIEYLQQVLDRGQLAGAGDGFQGKLEKAFTEAYGVKHAIAANAAKCSATPWSSSTPSAPCGRMLTRLGRMCARTHG